MPELIVCSANDPCATRTKLEKHAVARDEIFNWNKQEVGDKHQGQQSIIK